MARTLLYIIIISQIWLSVGSTCVHLLLPDCEFLELLGEEEKEKEKESEKEGEKINISKEIANTVFEGDYLSNFHQDINSTSGRSHFKNITPPPEFISFFS